MVGSYEEALELADETIETIFIIGGAQVFEQALKREETDGAYITHIHQNFDCDTFFPEIPKSYQKTLLGSDEEGGVKWDYLLYER